MSGAGHPRGLAAGPGEMARLVEDHDWAATGLGGIADWPERLRGHVELVLDSPMPMLLLWGPQLVQIYNDAFRALLGGRHPRALGQPTHDCWPKAREVAGPIYDAVLGGETRVRREQKLSVEREGRRASLWLDLTYSPLRDGAGTVAGVLVTAVDATARTQLEKRLRLAQEMTGVGTFEWNIRGDVNAWSPEIERLYGIEEGSFAGTYEAWAARVHPDDLAAAEEAVRAALEDGELRAEWRAVRPDGRTVWIEARGIVERDETGRPLRMLGANIDATERRVAETALRESEARARALVAELQHRVRNTLAVIRSIAARTAETSTSVEEFEMHLDGRIGSFARVQSAVTRDPGGGVDLAALIADELAAAAAHEGRRVSLKGPDVRLPPKLAEALGLAVHELTTNAVKHGALATPKGVVSVEWALEEDARPALMLEWKELHVEMPECPAPRRGFGTELLEHMLPYQVGAETEQRFEADGLRCAIRVPLPE
ncbi:MAG TPA: PAS domain-containing protein [Thermohalobaculum sp.]|nr:PAS domain-containing protein [Thermohalobaculum sp.]